ncbi:hypothetical protein [Tumebacillus permanentifrigoris]|uniref:Uncharacterized protein n=1 Tax=Tumebacillus permanentifrigoris TaxID=378543 RepID=A0A316D9H0_9BACL|nr:hypothetical protein [Tumebacillus permanentifrigoris]PWK11582.1 hypothetical protein C7459_110111 [Tumebacillus permanentifrigoris]
MKKVLALTLLAAAITLGALLPTAQHQAIFYGGDPVGGIVKLD